MTPEGSPKDDVKVPEGDIGTQISAGFDDGKELLVTIVSAMGEEQVSLVFTSVACAPINFRRLFRLRKPRKALLSPLPSLIASLFSVFPSCAFAFYALSFNVLTDDILLCMYFSWLDSACVLHSPVLRCRKE